MSKLAVDIFQASDDDLQSISNAYVSCTPMWLFYFPLVVSPRFHMNEMSSQFSVRFMIMGSSSTLGIAGKHRARHFYIRSSYVSILYGEGTSYTFWVSVSVVSQLSFLA